MKSDTIKSENMLRIRDLDLLNKLQEKYKLSQCKSMNDFVCTILKAYAFKDTREDEIVEKLEALEDTTNAIFEKVKNR